MHVTRHSPTHRPVRISLTLEARGARDESDSYRHKWTTTARVGLLEVTGANVAEVKAVLLGKLEALVNSPGAAAALEAEEAARYQIFLAERPTLGIEAALARLRARAAGRDPDAAQVEPEASEDTES